MRCRRRSVSAAKEIGQPALSEVPGLNSADGMQRVAGNEKLYRKLLRQFAATERDAAERIAAALAVHDRVLAEQLAHAVKGVAGNIGALRVQNAAANLEKAIGRSAAAADIESWLATLDECLGELVGGLNAALQSIDSDQAPAPAADSGEARMALDRLSQYLAESDAAAVECFESAAPHLRLLFGAEKVERLGSLIEEYAFTEAYEQLREAVEERVSHD